MDSAKKILTLFISCFLCVAVAMVFLCGQMTAYAETEKEIIYYDDMYNGDPTTGTVTVADYYVEYDSYTVIENVKHVNAPSFGNSNSSLKNYCGPLTGLNVVGFFDRWYTELIPDYDPGMLFGSGNYHYYPDLGETSTKEALISLYDLMKTAEVGGTTSANFKSGLNTYVANAGYSFSYSTCYKNKTLVDIDKLKTAINQNKVAVVMCSEYNYVLDIMDLSSESKMKVVKNNSTIAHMMMVYGYKTIAYYKDGVNFQTDTFLYVCSSYGSGDTGYMQLNDFSVIDEALIMTIS